MSLVDTINGWVTNQYKNVMDDRPYYGKEFFISKCYQYAGAGLLAASGSGVAVPFFRKGSIELSDFIPAALVGLLGYATFTRANKPIKLNEQYDEPNLASIGCMVGAAASAATGVFCIVSGSPDVAANFPAHFHDVGNALYAVTMIGLGGTAAGVASGGYFKHAARLDP